MLGAVRGGARARVVVEAHRLYGITQLLVLQGGIALGVDFGLALAVGRLCLLEDVDDVLGLQAVSGDAMDAMGASCGSSEGARTLLTTLPERLMTVMVSPTPMVAVAEAAAGGCRLQRVGGEVQWNVGQCWSQRTPQPGGDCVGAEAVREEPVLRRRMSPAPPRFIHFAGRAYRGGWLLETSRLSGASEAAATRRAGHSHAAGPGARRRFSSPRMPVLVLVQPLRSRCVVAA